MSESKEIDLKFLFSILYKWKFFIIIIVIICCSLTFLIGSKYITPVYESNAKVYLATSENIDEVDLDTIELSVRLMNTYKEMITTTVVLEKVLAKLPESNLTIKDLKEKIEVNVVSETPLMNIKVQDESHPRAQQIVNGLLDVIQKDIPDISRFNQVVILESPKGNVTDVDPVFPNYFFMTVIMIIFYFSVTFGILTFKEIFEEKVKTEEQLNDEFGLENLAIIPKALKKDFLPNKERGKLNEE